MDTHNWCTHGNCQRGAMKPMKPTCLTCSNYDIRSGMMRDTANGGHIRMASLAEHRRFMGVPHPKDMRSGGDG